MTGTLRATDESSARLARYNAERTGFTAGVLAAMVMLVAIFVLRLATGVISLPEIVAQGALMLIPGALFSAILDALRDSAKPLFYVAVCIGMLVVGGLIGRWYGGAEPTWRRGAQLAVVLWLAFGLGVYVVLGAGPFGAYLQAGPVWHGASLLFVFGVFGATLVQSHHVLRQGLLRGPDAGRRTLLRNAALATIATVAASGAWRALTTVEAPIAPEATPEFPPEVTPTRTFYTVSKNFIDPTVAVHGWRLKIDGLVDRPLELTYDELTSLASSEGYYTLMCISNEVGGDLWGNAHWRGVKLSYLLERAGVHRDADKAVFSAADDYRDSVHLDRALHPEALLAWEMNGEPLNTQHGFPARLLIPGIYGMKNVKWLNGIKIMKGEFLGYWQNQGWDDLAPYKTAARIDVPRSRGTLAAGPLTVGGVAFAGDRGIQAVELSTDGGQSWHAAQIKPGLGPNTWQLWRTDVPLDRSVRTLQVRATDGEGHLQTAATNPPFPSGSTGLHTITVAVS